MKRRIPVTENKTKYGLFCDLVENEVRILLGDGYEVRRDSRLKNNSVNFEGLTIREKDNCIAPTIYFNYFEKEYKDGLSPEEIAGKMVALYMKNRPETYRMEAVEECLRSSKANVIYNLVSRERNESLLETVPHRDITEDLSVVFRVIICEEENGFATSLVTYANMRSFGLKESELMSLAEVNTQRILPAKLTSLDEFVERMMEAPLSLETAIRDNNIEIFTDGCSDRLKGAYILTNDKILGGASAILYPGVAKAILNRYPGGYSILPSSIHELILVPKIADSDRAAAQRIVCEINETAVADTDVLSDRVYDPEEFISFLEQIAS